MIGTLAMLLVSGGIFVHHLPALHRWAGPVPGVLFDLAVGMLLGAIVVGVVVTLRSLFDRFSYRG